MEMKMRGETRPVPDPSRARVLHRAPRRPQDAVRPPEPNRTPRPRGQPDLRILRSWRRDPV